MQRKFAIIGNRLAVVVEVPVGVELKEKDPDKWSELDLEDVDNYDKESCCVEFSPPLLRGGIEYVVATSPLLGKSWVIPYEEARGRSKLKLPWRGKWVRDWVVVCFGNVEDDNGYTRSRLKKLGEICRPGGVSDRSWSIFLAWSKGEGYRTVAERFGCSFPNVQQTVKNVLKKMEKEREHAAQVEGNQAENGRREEERIPSGRD